jgi:hypothetical protein
MRTVIAVTALTATLALGGCDFKSKGNDCTTDPGLTTGGTSVCTQPPPSQFNQLGQ